MALVKKSIVYPDEELTKRKEKEKEKENKKRKKKRRRRGRGKGRKWKRVRKEGEEKVERRRKTEEEENENKEKKVPRVNRNVASKATDTTTSTFVEYLLPRQSMNISASMSSAATNPSNVTQSLSSSSVFPTAASSRLLLFTAFLTLRIIMNREPWTVDHETTSSSITNQGKNLRQKSRIVF